MMRDDHPIATFANSRLRDRGSTAKP